MRRSFAKMQGAGNDFVVIDARDHPFRPDPEEVRWIADRHYGIGCDQLLVIESRGAGLSYRVYNSDGSEAAQCGNGARCVARYLSDLGAIEGGDQLLSPTGGVTVDFEAGLVSVGMGVPSFEPADLPFDGASKDTIEVDGERHEFSVVSLGNPHAVVVVDDVDEAPVAEIAAAIQGDVRFADGVNVSLLAVKDRAHVKLRVVERGTGETLACGSGACAAVAAGRKAGLLDSAVAVSLPGGMLRVTWAEPEESMRLAGGAEYAFRGEFER